MEPRISIITLGVNNLKRSKQFYINMGLEPSSNPAEEIVFFKTQGTCLALYPLEKLQQDIGTKQAQETKPGSNLTLAHNVKEKSQVDEVLNQAQKHGAKIIKPANDTFWGGYSGYFEDLDGYVWEVAWGAFAFNPDGSLAIP